LLYNIFLFKGKNFQDLDSLNIYSYPDEKIDINNKDLIGKIIYGHDHGDLVHKYRNSKENSRKAENQNNNLYLYIIDTPVPQVINELNIFTTCINGKIIIGLLFEKDDNPFDYREIFGELLNELLNNEKCCDFNDEIEIENFLITIFIDIRRYGDEYVEKLPELEYHYQGELFNKIFLFGLDEVGKTSLVRRLKTGKFNDDHFTPTRKFNIEYIQEERGFLAFWDMPGQRLFRKKWLMGLQDANIIIYMIDIANQRRFEESKMEFWKILNRYELFEIPLLILSNKSDLIDQVLENNPEQLERLKKEVFDYFELENIDNRDWRFLFTSVKTNYNIDNVINLIFSFIQ